MTISSNGSGRRSSTADRELPSSHQPLDDGVRIEGKAFGQTLAEPPRIVGDTDPEARAVTIGLHDRADSRFWRLDAA